MLLSLFHFQMRNSHQQNPPDPLPRGYLNSLHWWFPEPTCPANLNILQFQSNSQFIMNWSSYQCKMTSTTWSPALFQCSAKKFSDFTFQIHVIVALAWKASCAERILRCHEL
jgi:hypothetical protein